MGQCHGLATGRRLGVDHRLLRSRTRHAVLEHRQSIARLRRQRAPGDNLYTNSVLALDPDSGTIRWHYQWTPHDVWDYDGVN